MREAEGCGAGPGLRDVGGAEQAATFVLTASEARHARGGSPGLESGPPGGESALVGAQPVRSRPGSPTSSQLACEPPCLASLPSDIGLGRRQSSPRLFPSPYASDGEVASGGYRLSSGLFRSVCR